MQSPMDGLPARESVFAGHGAHTNPADAFWYDPLGHSVHFEGPGTALTRPGAHATHTPPSGPEYPPSQRQSVMLALPSESERELLGQLKHAVPALTF
eukprot:701235-Rhodomonas_salina.1